MNKLNSNQTAGQLTDQYNQSINQPKNLTINQLSKKLTNWTTC